MLKPTGKRYAEHDEMDEVILALTTLSQKEKDRLRGRSHDEYGQIIYDHAWGVVAGKEIFAVEFESTDDAYGVLRLGFLCPEYARPAPKHIRFERDLGHVEFECSPHISVLGTERVGYLFASDNNIRRCFGGAGPGDGYAVDLEWKIRALDRQIAIYNYKNGPAYSYCSADKTVPISRMRKWHIGGADEDAVDIIYSIMKHHFEGEAK